jgi:hypothetical protein
LILGLVLGEVIERYMFISVQRYGVEWMLRPVVLILFAMAFLTLIRPLWEDIRAHGGVNRMLTDFGRPRFRVADLFYVFMFVVIGWMVLHALDWGFSAKVVPLIVGSMALTFAALGLLNQIFRKPATERVHSLGEDAKEEIEQKIHMDLDSDTGHLSKRVVLTRAAIFFGWLIAFMASMATIGLIPTVPLFVIAFMRMENRERWTLVLPQAIGLTVFIYIVFDQLLTIPWPATLLGTWVPALKFIPSV